MKHTLETTNLLVFRRAIDIACNRLHEHYGKHGYELKHLWVLMGCRDKECSQEEIAKVIYVDRSTIGAICASMEARGLIERTRTPGNLRRYTIMPTAKGREVLRWLDGEFDRAAAAAYYPMTLKEIKQVRTWALRIIESARAE